MRALLIYFSDREADDRVPIWALGQCIGYVRLEVVDNSDEVEALDHAMEHDEETFVNSVRISDEVQTPGTGRPIREFGFGIKRPAGGDGTLQAKVLEHKPRKNVHGVGESEIPPDPREGGSGETDLDL